MSMTIFLQTICAKARSHHVHEYDAHTYLEVLDPIPEEIHLRKQGQITQDNFFKKRHKINKKPRWDDMQKRVSLGEYFFEADMSPKKEIVVFP